MSKAAMPELRRAALTLHALGEHDRGWLLDRLAPASRESLRPLLEELEALGIPRDDALVRRALDVARSEAQAPGDAGDPDVAVLARTSAVSLLALLRDEPPGLVARLLAMRAWPWANELLQGFDASRRRRIAEATQDAWRGGAVVNAWLVADLAGRVRGLDTAIAALPGEDVR